MKGVITHGLLAAFGLVMAYTTWTNVEEKERPQEEIEIFECSAGRLKSVVLDEKRTTVRLEPKRDAGKAYYWFKVTSKPDTTTPTVAKKPQVTKVEQFVGNKEAEDFVKSITPLRALRSLGNVTGKNLKDLELDKPETKFSVECGGKSATYFVGGSTYGAGDRYIRAKAGGPIYLLPAATIRDFESASFKFMQRSLHRFELAEVDRIRVEAQGKKKELVQRNRRDPKLAQWVDASAPEKRNEFYGNWLDRVNQLRVQEFLAPGKEPGSEKQGASGSSAVLSLEYLADGESLGKTEVVRVDGNPVDYYARSEATRSWVKVVSSVGTQVEQDIPALLGLVEVPSSSRKGPKGAHGATPGGHGGLPGSSPMPAGHPPAGHPPVGHP